MFKVVIRTLWLLAVTLPLSLFAFGFYPNQTMLNFGTGASYLYVLAALIPTATLLLLATVAGRGNPEALRGLRSTLEHRELTNTFDHALYNTGFLMSTLILLMACEQLVASITLAVVILASILAHGYGESVADRLTPKRRSSLGTLSKPTGTRYPGR